MCGLVVSALVLSLVGALLQRGAAAALGVPARFVVGVGPRFGDREAPPRQVEVRPVIVWAWVPLLEGGSRARRTIVRAIGPLAIVLVPFSIQVGAIAAAGIVEELPSEALVVRGIVPGSPAEDAGIAIGDVVVSAAGQPVRSLDDLRSALDGRAGSPTALEIERDGAQREVNVTPEALGGRATIGIHAERPTQRRDVGIGEAIALAARTEHNAIVRLGALLRRDDFDGVSGPVEIVRAAREERVDDAIRMERLGMLAGLWTLHALVWSIVAAISEIVRATRGVP